MELRVWVDGTQRVVCGVKLSTTCQEIVFALAHATQQAGRFTMIERFRDNERLLSPNEQPLITIQRFGENINEAQFILRKTSSDLQPTIPAVQQQQQQQQQPQTQQHPALNPPLCPNHDEPAQHGISKNYPYDELYSTINKKCTNQPPAVPAKPRVIRPIANLPIAQPHPVNNAQVNYYQLNQNPLNVYSNHLRPRNPPGYFDYMEAIASRNSMTQPSLANPVYPQQAQPPQSNIFQRSFDSQHLYSIQQNGSSPNNNPSASNRYRYSLTNSQSNNLNNEMRAASSMQNMNMMSRVSDSNLVINRDSLINNRVLSANLNHSPLSRIGDFRENSPQNIANTTTSVSQMGLDMLKVIEEQKKVLINQKNEVDKLVNDREYWESKQSSEEADLINRIETEIFQLEELWKENQTQIQKLENQNFEKELEELKSEQVKMELELGLQKSKLLLCEKDIVSHKNKIKQLETDLANQESNDLVEDPPSWNVSSEEIRTILSTKSKEVPQSKNQNYKPVHFGIHTNGTKLVNDLSIKKEIKSSDEDTEDDSGGDASDDLNLSTSENKLRSAKDVAYVDKRGLISGIRSLKLDKSRALNRQMETMRSTESINSSPATSNLSLKEKVSTNNNLIEKKRCPETNGQHSEKTANNKYELLMTL